MTLSVAIFLPLFVTAVTGGHGHVTPTSAKVLMYVLELILAACVGLVAVGIWKNLARANNAE